MASTRVKYIKTHSTIFVHGVGDLGFSLPNERKKEVSFSLMTSDHGVHGYIENQRVLIPWANIQILVLDENG